MSPLLIDLTYFEGRDRDIVVKELAAVDCHSNRVTSSVIKIPYAWEEVPMFTARMNDAIDNGFNWNDRDVLYSVLETVVHRAASSALAIYCFVPQKTNYHRAY